MRHNTRPQSAQSQHVEILDSAPPDDLKPQKLQSQDGVHLGSVVQQKEQPKGVPQKKWYRVKKGGRVLDPLSKLRLELRAGKEISDLEYNVKSLVSQGVVLEEIKDDDRTIGGFAI